MRDPERLDSFYAELCRLHKEYLPDWRFGQFMYNVMAEIGTTPFFFQNEVKTLKVIKDYIREVTGKEVE